MKCECGCEKFKTLDTRQSPTGAICRRKACTACGTVFWTAETKLDYVPDYYIARDPRLRERTEQQ